ncbi:MAG: hypothetical protein ACLP25_00560, partial [Roseiarcus sp.]
MLNVEDMMLAAREQDRLAPAKVVPTDALRGFFLIMDKWQVGAEDARVLLGSPPSRTYYAWRAGNGVRVPADTLRRIGYVAGIFKALQIVYSFRGGRRGIPCSPWEVACGPVG